MGYSPTVLLVCSPFPPLLSQGAVEVLAPFPLFALLGSTLVQARANLSPPSEPVSPPPEGPPLEGQSPVPTEVAPTFTAILPGSHFPCGSFRG